jgi:hypothetical protein
MVAPPPAPPVVPAPPAAALAALSALAVGAATPTPPAAAPLATATPGHAPIPVPELSLFAQAAPRPDASREPAVFAPRPPAAPPVPPAHVPVLPLPTPAATAPAEFAIFSGLAAPREAAPPAPPAPAGSTLSRLKQVVTHPGTAGLPEPVSGRAAPDAPQRPSAGAIPAAAVTVPLGDVMRLVASGGPPAASPFDTFRAALRAPSSF